MSTKEPIIKKFPTPLYIVLVNSNTDVRYFYKNIVDDCFFVKVLQMNTLPNRKNFAYALTCCK